MSRCPVANEIAIHCDDEEIYCPKCTSVMVYSKFDTQVLMCTDDECWHSIDTEDK